MRLLLVCDAYLPTRKSVAVQMGDLAGQIVAEGHQVALVTLSEELAEPWTLAVEGGVDVLRVAIGPTKSAGHSIAGLLKRAGSEMLFSRLLWRALRQSELHGRKFDGVVWYSPSIFLAGFVDKVKRRDGCRSYLILRDIFPLWAVEAGVMRRGLAYLVLRQFEKYQYRVADVIGVQSVGDLDYFSRTRMAEGRRVEVLHNWVRDVTGVSDAMSGSRNRCLVFGGTMGVAQDMDNVLRLAARLLDQEIQIVLVGTGSEVDRLRKVCDARRLTNVEFAGEKSPEAYRELISGCLAGLVSLDRRLTTNNIPGKVISYLSVGLPVIASVNSGNDLKVILENSGSGYVCWNGNDEEFLSSVMRVADSPALRSRLSENAIRLCRDMFSVSSKVRQILSALQKGVVRPQSE